MYNPTIYSASKIWHAPKWLELRDIYGFNIIATWINIPCGSPENKSEAKILTPAEKRTLWYACKTEPVEADFTVIYSEPGDEHRGALVEIGAALGAGKYVYMLGQCATLKPAVHSDVAFTYDSRAVWVPEDLGHKAGYQWALMHYQQAHGAILQLKKAA